ncbi:RNA binding protein fox-1 homolog 2-like isoform X2 [Physeter macrocephalus]|uniref:RNA binding protein fox-1 homolog 2-like isoform X2 n=1 Tax=Physeter macrocephalus TaxID=9755 RepID=A0A455BE01_PHYMC|nr:RNA binding protein fox-1 homolog 2-like isoform X2 [Physeter catodon]|eukprot:XP_028342206.1 RNA binding protein fox-1 homolog 2-like isoform X2 [Physeter catodon]
MAEGAQPQQPPQLGPGAAARGMKRESELELPVPGGGGDGPEPGLSKRPRTEEAAADGGGMQVSGIRIILFCSTEITTSKCLW